MKFFIKSVFLLVLFFIFSTYIQAETFHSICKDGSVQDVAKALKDGGDINSLSKDLQTPLMQASKYNSPEVVQFLIDSGANVNAGDKDGKTALMYACESNTEVEVVRILITKNADVNAQTNKGKTALMFACESNKNMKIVDSLEKAGADLKAKTKDGKTALYYAEKNQNQKYVKMLKSLIALSETGSKKLSE